MRNLCKLIMPTLMLVGCEKMTVTQVTTPEMGALYQEALKLGSVESDSVKRFAEKLDYFIQTHPGAENEPLYSGILVNLDLFMNAPTVNSRGPEDGVQPNDSNAVDPEAQPITFNVTIDQWIDEDKQTDM